MATKGSKNDECVRVMVRIRPISTKERQDGRVIITTANFDRAEVTIANPTGAEAPKAFTFDAAFPAECTQQQVYDAAATGIVEAVMEGYNGTIFAYGQTGAGKSHTMEGLPEPAEQRGIIPNSFKHIFDKIALAKNKRILVRASYLEIYNEEIRDLLSKDPKARLDLKENVDSGVYVKGLTAQVVKDAQEIDHVMQMGKKNRSVGATLMNQTSSRSHSIFTIVVESLSENGLDGKDHVCVGKLNLVDLAGSERQSKTGATGDRLQEANKINLSLSALGNVISALVDGKSKHIPYRDSKLTRLLQDSLGGNTKTVMIANCGPADYNYEETLTTLRYASRAKNIKNKPKINEDPKDAMIREYQEEIEALKAKLMEIEATGGAVGPCGANGQTSSGGGSREIVEVEKIVEKIVIEKGVSEEEAKAIAERTRKEKEEVLKKAHEEIAMAAKDKAMAEKSKLEIEQKLEMERQQAEEIAAQQKALMEKLASMQAKVLIGGEMITKAMQQEDELRRKRLELEERKQQELQLAREVAEKEEANLMKEEKYQNLQEEAEAKTKKLKKVYTKVKEVLTDIKQLEKTQAREREDLLDTIRQLTCQLKLKNVVVNYFIPQEYLDVLEHQECIKWSEEDDDYILENLDRTGNAIRPSVLTANTSSSSTNGTQQQQQLRPSSASPSSNSSTRRPEIVSKKKKDLQDFGGLEDAMEEEKALLKNPYFVYLSDEEGDGYAPAATHRKPKKAATSSSSSSSSSSTTKSSKSSSSSSSKTSSSKSKRPESARKRQETKAQAK